MRTTFDHPTREEHSEGTIARTIENQTAKLPSETFLIAALSAIMASALLQILGKQRISLFVGQWVPTFLLFGVYNKLVKQLGNDRLDNTL